MSVPLDRLYDFLQTLCNHDVLIYRYFPHGSRKIEDCVPLIRTDLLTKLDTMCMVCHDQEPLNYKEFEPCLPFKLEQQKFFPVLQTITHMYGSLYDKILLCHSELRSQDLEWFEQHGSLGVYYWSHAIIARDWYRYAEHDTRLLDRTPSKDFLIYNRAWSGLREYRIKFTEHLINAQLHPYCTLTFNPNDGNHHYRDHKFKNASFVPHRWDFEQVLPQTQAPASSSADYDVKDYCHHRIEVVLETVFDDTKWHLTEKTLRPIACGMPFILMSSPGTLQYLRSYGFQTFDSVWDESYDSIEDSGQRLQAVVQLMSNIANMTLEEKLHLDQQCADIVAHNQRKFFSDQFWQQVTNEFTQNLNQALDKMQTHTNLVRQHILSIQ
jgi:hypothetical protein